MSKHTRIAPMPTDDIGGIYETNPNNIELKPGSYTHIADWMRVAVSIACGPTATLEDVLLFSIVWSLTHNGNDKRTHATRSWLAARMCIRDLDTVTASANHLAAAGLITKENETRRKVVQDPDTGKFVKADVPTTNWRLSVCEDSPAVQAALAWERGEEEERQREAEKKYRAVNELSEMSAFGSEIIDRINPDALAALTDEDGHINLDLLASAVTQTLIGMGVIAASGGPAHAGAETESSAQTTSAPSIASPTSDDPEGWAELKAATKNHNNIDAAKELYRKCLAAGKKPDVVRAAWIACQRSFSDGYYPQLLSWFNGERGCKDPQYCADACISKEEERRRKISGCVEVDDDDVPTGFDPDAYKESRDPDRNKPDDAMSEDDVIAVTGGFLSSH